MKDLLKRLDRTLARRPMPSMCFATSAAALGAAALGALINYALAEFMAVTGMLTVSLFFLGLGLLHRNEVIEDHPQVRERRSLATHSGAADFSARHLNAAGTHNSLTAGQNDAINEPIGVEA